MRPTRHESRVAVSGQGDCVHSTRCFERETVASGESMVPVHAPKWMVCLRQTRSIVDGEVDCPRGDLVPWQQCLGCHVLETVDDEREIGCGEVETPGLATGQEQSTHRDRWPQLMIELL